MTAEVDVANRALALIGTRSQIASLQENSNEAINCNLIFASVRDELLRLAPWNCATNFNNLSLICAAPGTPENPSAAPLTWSKGIPAPPWSYEYAYPSDCLRPLWIIPQFSTGFSGGVPITTAVTGGAPSFWNGPPVRFKVSIDQISSTTGLPAVGGDDTRVILTNQQQAILAYIKQVTNSNVWDVQFQSALSFALAARLVFALSGDKGLANLKIQEANNMITIARQGDGNEGLTVNDVTPDWIRIRGISPISPNFEYSPNQQFDWGPMLTMY
jgi:hypothetical protein